MIETQYAWNQCSILGITRNVIKVGWNKPERTLPTKRTINEIKGGVSEAFFTWKEYCILIIS